MALCNAHYYATRDPLGAAGDFVTAPEISQMFGELIGIWCTLQWNGAGRPPAAWVELGPGRGTLAADAQRAMRKLGFVPTIHLVETSPVLAAAQRKAVPAAIQHDRVDTLPADRPLLIVANEFFDALPIRQLVRSGDGWRERLVDVADDRLAPTLGAQRYDAAIPEALRDAPPGSTLETSPACVATMRALAARLVAQGGALLAIDYGYAGPAIGDTFQAMRAHAFADPFAHPGEQDLTAHVDFTALAEAARAEGAVAHPLESQGALLSSLGIAERAAGLAQAYPARQGELEAAWRRLCAPEQMGTVFKALAITAPGWPIPGGST
jgi:SAM-dependent MidA family methyltransferase